MRRRTTDFDTVSFPFLDGNALMLLCAKRRPSFVKAKTWLYQGWTVNGK